MLKIVFVRFLAALNEKFANVCEMTNENLDSSLAAVNFGMKRDAVDKKRT